MLKAITLALTLVATPLAAETKDTCLSVGTLATSVMQARQAGVDLGRAMEIAGDSSSIQAMVLMAYGEPRFSTDEYQQNAVADFANTWMLSCYEAK
mgnify:FL=1